jgi:phage replication-related protein YjqB (UPF0714/DUF867 family)
MAISEEADVSRDKYRNFEELRAHEEEGKDYIVRLEPAHAPVAIIAPHGGKIEPGTSEVATAIAGTDYNLYCFEGSKKSANVDLHITSTNFDEKRCQDMITGCDIVVAVHGLAGDQEAVDVGGLDQTLRDAIAAELQAAGFKAKTVVSGSYAAIDPVNICNRGRSRAGAQLEITRGLRDALKADETRMRVFVQAMQQAIASRVTK